MQLGVDVGGTNTDAALLADGAVIASIKTPTTADIGGGIVRAIRKVLRVTALPHVRIDTVAIGTTQFTNAFVERRRLNPVGIIRMCLPAARDLAPMAGWPADVRNALGDHAWLLPGGYEFDGREIAPFDEEAVHAAVSAIKSRGLRAVAVSCVCSPINGAMEQRVAEIVAREIPDAAITLSGEIGKIGLVERENAAIINASMSNLSRHVIDAIREALQSMGIAAPFHLSQNDGTLMSAEHVERYPVLTFSSGPTNSMRGAAFLSRVRDGIVVDIGGTTTDVGALVNGYPRELSLPVDIGGVRTNFRMPDVVSVGLGGGSIVREQPTLSIGPDSVGFRLTEEARVFGGETLTATDIVVAAGLRDIGDRSRVSSLDPKLIDQALRLINRTVEDVIDQVKTQAGDVPIVLVGGGSIIVSDELKGADRIVVPRHSAEANAVGAAMAQVGGVVDRVYSYREQTREASIERAKAEASRRVVDAGGDPTGLEIVEIEEVPLTYSGNQSVRIRVKAVSNLLHAERVLAGTACG